MLAETSCKELTGNRRAQSPSPTPPATPAPPQPPQPPSQPQEPPTPGLDHPPPTPINPQARS